MAIKWYQDDRDDPAYEWKFPGEEELDTLAARARAAWFRAPSSTPEQETRQLRYNEICALCGRARGKYNEAYRAREAEKYALLVKLRAEDDENYTYLANDLAKAHKWPPVLYDASAEVAEAEAILARDV
jgi:hypothetical protein